ncbi:MAG TPA: hypothetical protein VIJ22_06450 [Polyangiaceae bacterium]
MGESPPKPPQAGPLPVVRVALLVLAPVALVVGVLLYRKAEGRPPTHEMCVAQADHRIALHEDAELPSIARGIASTRDSMIATCERYWSRIYVDCLVDAPTLVAVEQCEKVGRVRP